MNAEIEISVTFAEVLTRYRYTIDPQQVSQLLVLARSLSDSVPSDEDIKQRAYGIDPSCWGSYSGSPKETKQAMDRRRTAALKQAAWELS